LYGFLGVLFGAAEVLDGAADIVAAPKTVSTSNAITIETRILRFILIYSFQCFAKMLFFYKASQKASYNVVTSYNAASTYVMT
jgi:hypothetical protein